MTKRCTTCNVDKPLDSFCRNHRHKDGLNYRCKQCSREYDKRYNVDNRQRRMEYKARYRIANREKIAEYAADRADKQRAYYETNKDAIKAYQKRKRFESRDAVRVMLETDLHQRMKFIWKGRMSHARKKNIVFDIAIDDLVALHAAQGAACALTGIPFDMSRSHGFRASPLGPSIDRIDPARGYVIDNVQLVCFVVNMAKSEYPIELFNVMCRARVEQLNRG